MEGVEVEGGGWRVGGGARGGVGDEVNSAALALQSFTNPKTSKVDTPMSTISYWSDFSNL